MRANSRPDLAVPTPQEVADGAEALGLPLSGVQIDQLSRFAALLMRWNAVHNLTAIRSPGEILSHHLLDSLAVLRPIASICCQKECRLLDVGAGGGLPGIPLAIARTDWSVTLVDKVQKKVAFLNQAKVELQLPNLTCVHGRVEDLRAEPFDVIVSRAFSSLAEFVRVSRHLLAPGGWWAAMKGAVPRAELGELGQAHPDVRVIDVVKLAVPRLDAERHLILLQRH